MHKRFAASIVVLSLAPTLFATPAVADSGVYIGGGAGQASIEDRAGNPGGVSFDESSTGLKLFAGYNLDVLPLVKFAAEVGYRDLGQAEGSAAGIPADYRISGFDYGVLAGVGLGPVDLFGRVGGLQYELEKNVGGIRSDFDGTAPVYGVGLWFTLVGIGIRAEYEVIDIDELEDVNVMSLSVFYKF